VGRYYLHLPIISPPKYVESTPNFHKSGDIGDVGDILGVYLLKDALEVLRCGSRERIESEIFRIIRTPKKKKY
jgi:hypothetical protein